MMLKIALVALVPIVALAQTTQQAEVPADQDAPADGLWPTEQMIESTVSRVALETADAYQLSDEQYEQVRDGMVERWSTFLQENRRELQPLVNEWFEARVAIDPPSAEQVQDWASRAMPVFEKIQAQVDAGTEQIRSVLTPEQRARFDAEIGKNRFGLDHLGRQLARWRKGEYTEQEWWSPPPGRRLAKKGQAAAPAAVQPADEIDRELDAWDRYVENFIAQYGLSDAQQTAARSVLKEVKERADAHHDRHRTELIELERKIAAADRDSRQDLTAEVERLYGPFDALFQELQVRLEKLLTQAQHRAASQPANQRPERKRRLDTSDVGEPAPTE